MEWYYAIEEEQKGPVDETTFKELCRSKTITGQTLVWNKTMTDWQSWDQVKNSITSAARNSDEQISSSARKRCSECGKTFEDDELVAFQGAFICAACKPVFLQKIREGVSTGQMIYAGFWIRFAAKFIDGLILWVVNMICAFASAFFMPSAVNTPEDMTMAMIPTILITLVNWAINISYTTWFLGKHSATPGKMICGLKVVTPQNTQITYMRAFGRFFAELLSSLILCIGFIMAAFDEEKRTLHDRICSTRVIKK